MGHTWSEYVTPETTPLRDKPSQFDPHYGFTTHRREKSNSFLNIFKTIFLCITNNIIF